MYNILTMFNKQKSPAALLNSNLNKTATVSSKGQVVIPKAIRDRLNIKAQDQLTFMVDRENIIIYPQTRLEDMQGRFFRQDQKPISLQHMKKIIKQAVQKKYGAKNGRKDRS